MALSPNMIAVFLTLRNYESELRTAGEIAEELDKRPYDVAMDLVELECAGWVRTTNKQDPYLDWKTCRWKLSARGNRVYRTMWRHI